MAKKKASGSGIADDVRPVFEMGLIPYIPDDRAFESSGK